MKYELRDFNRNVPDKDLLDDLKRVAENLEIAKISTRQYDNNGGKYSSGTISVRFGGWNKALQSAGLKLVHQRDISQVELFRNFESVWIQLGRQPVYRDIQIPISKFSIHQYIAKFGTWRKTLEQFIFYINPSNKEDELESIDQMKEIPNEKRELIYKHNTKRIPSERLKVQVLMRDGNKCKLCGITLTGDSIHFDHIIPWSKGGETVLENLQILCAKHNLAKGNLEYNTSQ